MDTRPTNMPTTRAAVIREDPHTTILAETSAYHNRFLPIIVRKLKANLNKVSVNQQINVTNCYNKE